MPTGCHCALQLQQTYEQVLLLIRRATSMAPPWYGATATSRILHFPASRHSHVSLRAGFVRPIIEAVEHQTVFASSWLDATPILHASEVA